MEVIRVSAWAKSPGTRDLGIAVREQIEAAFRDRPYVTLDFSGVEAVSNSFADEVLGKLVTRHGLADVKFRVRIINVSLLVRTVLQSAIANRLMSMSPMS